MKIALIRWSIRALIVVISLALAGCVVGGYGGGYGYDDRSTVGYGVGYYEPSGHDYGGWGPGYQAGPPPHGGYDHPCDRIHIQPITSIAGAIGFTSSLSPSIAIPIRSVDSNPVARRTVEQRGSRRTIEQRGSGRSLAVDWNC